MDDLPEDVLIGILRRLAVQDPLSFVGAVASCKAFEAAAERNPVLWKEAFYGLGKEQRIWAIQNRLTEEGETLEAEVEGLRGYKRILQASGV